MTFEKILTSLVFRTKMLSIYSKGDSEHLRDGMNEIFCPWLQLSRIGKGWVAQEHYSSPLSTIISFLIFSLLLSFASRQKKSKPHLIKCPLIDS